nr:MAG TPA: hypothetical protein [Caudoviricetes sp.]
MNLGIFCTYSSKSSGVLSLLIRIPPAKPFPIFVP